MLGNGMSSRMFRNLRDSDGLAYQLGSSHKLKALKGYFVTYIGTNPKNVKSCEEKILAEINKLKTEFVDLDSYISSRYSVRFFARCKGNGKIVDCSY